jgi:hypothetical protein
MLWAWEEPIDLRFLQPNQAGVAFLAASFHLEGDRIDFAPRMQPLRVAPSTYLMAVVRIDSSIEARPAYSMRQRRELVQSIVEVVATTGVKALQIDFDARQSERTFYRALIPDVRKTVGPSVFLSITALASWCEEGNWVGGLGADETVPMLFRMGPTGGAVRARLVERGQFPSRACRSSIGYTPDEPGVSLKRYQRVYVFPPWGWVWNARQVDAVLRETSRP